MLLFESIEAKFKNLKTYNTFIHEFVIADGEAAGERAGSRKQQWFWNYDANVMKYYNRQLISLEMMDKQGACVLELIDDATQALKE